MSFDQKTLGGGINGISVRQSNNNKRSAENVMTRRILTKSWNTGYATGTMNGYGRAIGPMRAVTNSGDFLNRQNYICGGPNQTTKGSMISKCDKTKIPSSTTNVKFVPDSSDYIRFKKQMAMNHLYNDNSL